MTFLIGLSLYALGYCVGEDIRRFLREQKKGIST